MPTKRLHGASWRVWIARLGVLPGHVDSRARAVSGDGSIVVGHSATEDFEISRDMVTGESRAFMWDAEHGLQNLKTVLGEGYHANVSGWQLLEAIGISADGCTIVGNGVNPQGDIEPWMAVIPSQYPAIDLDIVKPKLPDHIISGDGTKVTLPVVVTNLSESPIEKSETIDLIIKARPIGGGPDMRLMVIENQVIGVLKPEKTKTISVALYLPPGIPTNDYIFVVQVGMLEVTTSVGQPVVIEFGEVILVGEITKSTLPVSLIEGETAKGTVSVQIMNQGNIAVEKNKTVDVGVLLQSQTSDDTYELKRVENYKIGGLKPGKNKTASVSVKDTASVPKGTYNLLALIEHSDKSLAAEPVLDGEVTVQQPFVDLTAEVISPKIPEQVTAGDGTKITIPVTITNNGNVSLAQGQLIEIAVKLRQRGHSWEESIKTLFGQSVSNLAPGKSKKISVTVSIPAAISGGDYHIIVWLDSLNRINESDENNNTFTLDDDINILDPPPGQLALPDLTVVSVDLPSQVQSGASLLVTTIVENLGPGSSSDTWLEFYLSTNSKLNDDDFFLEMAYVPSLAGGEIVLVSESLPIPAVAKNNQKLYLIVVVDPFEDCMEGGKDNKNNILSQSARIYGNWPIEYCLIHCPRKLRPPQFL